ncbi:MAG: sulfatase [bacterium]
MIFENTYSPQPWTLTSHLSMLTSLYPETHDVREGLTLGHKWQTLAEILKRNGYATGGFVTSSNWLDNRYGCGRGFDHYWCRDEQGEKVNAAVADFVSKNRNKPIFLFIHYYDVHSGGRGPDNRLPYHAPEEIRKLFMPDRARVFTGGDGVHWSTSYLLHAEEKGIGLNDAELEELRGLYDSAVRLADTNLCNLFAMLKKEDVFENSIIIITADHGEELQDHGHFLHFQLYEEVFRVPLIIRIPRKPAKAEPRIKEPQRIPGLVSLVDIFPTALDCLGISYPENQVQGQSLLPVLRGRKSAHRYVFATEFDLIAKQSRMAVRDESWKLICTGDETPR